MPPRSAQPGTSRREHSLIYEYRRYHVTPGRMGDLVDRMCNHTAGFFEAHGIRLVGAWTTVVGNSNELHHILAWTDMSERQERWAAFSRDPGWLEVLATSDGEGKIRDFAHNELWAPIDCSPLQ
jgi:NIPSNAP